MSAPGAGFSLSEGWDLSGLTLTELWLRYLDVGGTASPDRVAAYARGLLRPDSYQHNMIAQAINEYFIDQGEDHPVGYQDIPLLPQRQGSPRARKGPGITDQLQLLPAPGAQGDGADVTLAPRPSRRAPRTARQPLQEP
jgi:hypothetical protein